MQPLLQLFPTAQKSSGEQAKVDIIAVHGLNPKSKTDNNHARDAWCKPSGPEGHLWLRDDLPEYMPASRIFLYDYDSTAVWGKDRDTFIGKANELLEAIRTVRQGEDCRPILFFAHSMGGLLVKQALVNAQNNSKYTPIKDATTGIAFFATPHKGGNSKLVSIGSMAARIAIAMGFQKGDNILEVLRSSGIYLDMLQELWRHQVSKYDIVSFWGALDKVVPKENACEGLPGELEKVVKLKADHRGVCKFGNDQLDQHNFELVLSNVRIMYNKALNVFKPPNGEVSSVLPTRALASPCSIIPFPQNESVVHRPVIASELDALLPPSSPGQSAALWGLGGSGKTQVALAFAYRRSLDPACSVFWVHADNETTFAQDYQLIAGRLGLGAHLNGRELLMAVCRRIEAEPNWVLVLDNADDLTCFGVGDDHLLHSARDQANLYNYVPRGATGTILWTSRDGRIGGSLVGAGRAINVTCMTDDEASTLLETVRNKKIDDSEIDDAARLLLELDRLPLAVSQAASYMHRTSTTIKEYLSILDKGKHRWEVLLKKEFDRHRRPRVSKSLLETWNISIEHIQRENPTAFNILNTLAFLDSQNIPMDLINEITAIFSDEEVTRRQGDTSVVDDEIASDEGDDFGRTETIREAVACLQQFSFLHSRTSDDGSRAFEIHKLVQEATRFALSRKDGSNNEVGFSKVAFQAVMRLFPNSVGLPKFWGQCARFAAHAQQICDWVELHGADIDIEPLLARLADYMFAVRMFGKKESMDRRIYELRKARLGEDDPDTLVSLSFLGFDIYSQGRLEEAEKLYLKVLAARREVLGGTHLDTTASLRYLAWLYKDQGRYDKSEKMLDDVLAMRLDTLGQRDPFTLEIMTDLGSIYHLQGRLTEAEDMQKKALALQREVLGEDHFCTTSSVVFLASTFFAQGRPQEAEPLLARALESRRRSLGDRHHDTLQVREDLAQAYYTSGKLKEAHRLWSEVLVTRLAQFGEKHVNTTRTMTCLAQIHADQEEYEQAEELSKKAVVLIQEIVGDRHPETLVYKEVLARIYTEQGKCEQAEEICNEILPLKRDLFGDRNPATMWTMHLTALCWHKQMRYPQAVAMMEDCVRLRRECLGSDHPHTLRAQEILESWSRPTVKGRRWPGFRLALRGAKTRKAIAQPPTVSG